MEEISINTDKCTEIKTLTQNSSEYDNYSVSLLRCGKRIIYVENKCTESTSFLLDKTEAAEAMENPQAWLEDCTAEWANNNACDFDGSESSLATERIAWGLDKPSELETSPEYQGEVEVVRIENFYGYWPVSSLGTFNSYAAAQKKIDEETEGQIYLRHNEAGPPNFYIIPA